MQLSEKPLLAEAEIQRRVRELAAEINAHYQDRPILALAVLKGAAFFAADLLKHLCVPVAVDFVRARSYQGAQSSGAVEFCVWPDCPIADRHILIIEDILDTGRTCAAILEKLNSLHPASVAICTLLDKPSRRVRDVHPRFTGFTIPDHFVVGYGMDYNEDYRNLASIHTLLP